MSATVAPRSRVRAAIALAVVITAGLASRTLGRDLPPLISKHLGDTLWSLMFYLIILSLRPATKSTSSSARSCRLPWWPRKW